MALTFTSPSKLTSIFCRFDISVLYMLAAQEMHTRRYAFHYEGNIILGELSAWPLKAISVSLDNVVTFTSTATYEKKTFSSTKPLKAVTHGLHEETNEISRLHNSVSASNVFMKQFK